MSVHFHSPRRAFMKALMSSAQNSPSSGMGTASVTPRALSMNFMV